MRDASRIFALSAFKGQTSFGRCLDDNDNARSFSRTFRLPQPHSDLDSDDKTGKRAARSKSGEISRAINAREETEHFLPLETRYRYFCLGAGRDRNLTADYRPAFLSPSPFPPPSSRGEISGEMVSLTQRDAHNSIHSAIHSDPPVVVPRQRGAKLEDGEGGGETGMTRNRDKVT